MSEVLQGPEHACRVLEDNLFGVCVNRVGVLQVGQRRATVGFDATFAPLPELERAGYEAERGRVSALATGEVLSFPLGPDRSWRHREPSPFGSGFEYLAGELCLFYPPDPRALRWKWADGLEEYVTRVHRHLFFEEFYRREGHWPVEDAPHGPASDGVHPIRSALMRKEVPRWKRQ